MNLSQKFLLVSGASLIVLGLLYGVAPRFILGDVIGLLIQGDQLHIYRSIMGLYCGLGGFLIYGSLKEEFTLSALLVEAIYLAGLAAGRIVSLIIDGYIHWFSIFAVALELPLFFVCLLLIKKYKFI